MTGRGGAAFAIAVALAGAAEPAGAAERDPFAARALLGPFATLAAYCETLAARGGACDDPAEPEPDEAATAPFLDVRSFGSIDGARRGNLAIRTARGWFVAEDFIDANEMQHAGSQDAELAHVVRRAGPGGAPLVEVRFAVTFPARDCMEPEATPAPRGTHGHLYYQSCAEKTAWCGLGPSGAPACTAAVQLAFRTFCGGEVRGDRRRSGDDGRLTARLGPGGELRISVARARRGASWTAPLVGVHSLAFP